MKVLVIGTGAREHAIVRALTLDSSVDSVIAAPGNPGIDAIALCRQLPKGLLDGGGVAALAVELGVDLVIVGPEAPLVAGVADAVRARGVACFGPTAQAARLEGSKAFAKEVMAEAGVPTALAHVCTTVEEVASALDVFGSPYVVKDDGLAAGKGVVVTNNRAKALAHAVQCLNKPNGRIVVEEFLDGPEISLFCITDGTTVVPLAPAQDFKRLSDNDQGPNTGGMGVYSPVPGVDSGDYSRMLEILEMTARALHADGIEFRGILYGGFILTAEGPKVLEYNTRFGDPETQVLLPRLNSDLAEVLMALAEGELESMGLLSWTQNVAVSVVMASAGYPGEYGVGKPITGIEAAEQIPVITVYHAGTKIAENGELVSAGGRVLNVTAVARDFPTAVENAYKAVELIQFDGSFFRHDIAHRALSARQPS